MKKITVGQFLDAIEKDGYTQAFTTLVGGIEANNVTRSFKGSACAVGQGLLNIWNDEFNDENHPNFSSVALPFYTQNEYRFVERVICPVGDPVYSQVFDYFVGYITHLNDAHALPLVEIVKYARHDLKLDLDNILGEA